MIKLTPPQLSQALTLIGWKLDKYQSPCKQVGDQFLRVKLGPQYCTVERRTHRTPTAANPSRTGWVILERKLYSEVSITDSCQIKIGALTF